MIEIIYFKTKAEAEEFKDYQDCNTRMYYHSEIKAYQVTALTKYTLFKEYHPNTSLLDAEQYLFNDYCKIRELFQETLECSCLTKYEAKELTKFKKQFDKFMETKDGKSKNNKTNK